jgi:predicted nucleic acid-binding protein
MRPTLVDSNVIFDVGEGDPVWRVWSEAAIRRCLDEGLLVINSIIYAEVSVGYRTVEEVEAVLPTDLYRREPLPYDAAFLAGKSFLAYRRRGGRRTAPLPDFYIGAHAAVSGYRLLTRDVQRFQTYFPTVALITP